MAKKILLVVAVAVLGLVGFIATRPAEFRIQRSVVINAPLEVIQAQLVDFHKWETWSPWEKMDPNQKRTYSGPASGVGAEYAWSGNDEVGQGKMIIKNVQPNQVTIELAFLAPMEATNMVVLDLAPQGEATSLTWSMTGQNGFGGKAFSLVMNMDEMVGKDFEKGLATLKSVSEDEAKKVAEAKAAAEAAAAEAAAAAAAAAAPAEGAMAADTK